MELWRTERRSAVSLIELLCVVVIILILASLLLGPVLRAYRKVKNFAGETEGSAVVELAVDRLRRFHLIHPTHGSLTADYLHREAIFDSKFMKYVREKKVTFFVFSSSDSDDKLIISYTFSTNNTGFVLKSRVTNATESRE